MLLCVACNHFAGEVDVEIGIGISYFYASTNTLGTALGIAI